jgi:gliding motility-associated-like protein
LFHSKIWWFVPLTNFYTMQIIKRYIPVFAGLLLSLSSFAQPANDDCTGATAVVPDGSCLTATTVLATDSWTNLIGCQGGAVGLAHDDVWFSFVATGSSFTTTATAGPGWAGDLEITLMEPGALGCLDVFTELASNCGPSPVVLSTTGLTIGNTYYIIVSNTQTGTTGQFDLCTTTSIAPASCVDNDDCSTAATIVLNASGNPGTVSCVTDCNLGAAPGIDFVGNICEDMLGPTVWYTFTTDALATTLDITLTSLDFGTPEFTLWQNTCNPWNGIPGSCVEGTLGAASISGLAIAPNTTYILAVSDVGGGQGNFDLCIGQNFDASACNTSGLVSEASSSDPSTPVGGPYSPGETVNFCYTINPYLNGASNWMSGIVPSFGDCWDPSSFDVNGMPVTTTALITAGVAVGNWAWYPAGAVSYNAIVGSLPPGTPLPAGWYFVCTGCGAGNDGPTPDGSYGDGPSITGETWTVCFDLIAGIAGNCTSGQTDCTVSMKTYADGEIGSWTSIGCVLDQPDVLPAAYLCCPIFDPIAAVTVCDSFVLPLITGTFLTGSEMYFDGPLGTGTAYSAGNTINYADYGSYPVTIYVYDPTACGAEVSFSLTIGQTPTVTFTALVDQCVDAGIQLGNGGGAPVGGIYSGTGVIDDGNGTTYTFNPATAGVGTHVITYTVTTAEGCSSFATDNVEVFALPILTFTALTDLCVNAGIQLGNGGATTAGGVYSGAGVTDDGNGSTYTFNPATAGVGVHILTYTFTDANSCTNSITDNVEVFALPVLTFTALADLCIDGGIQLGNGGATAPGGVYSGPGVTDDGNGTTYTFNPTIAGLGTHILTYSFTDPNGCTNSITDNVEVFALPVLTFTALVDLCIDAGIQLGNGGATAPGGVYSGTGVTDDGNGSTYTFNPATAGVGVHILTYTFTDVNSCTNSITDNVEVFALPVLTFTALADLCVGAGVQAGLGSGTATGGVYSGAGVTDAGDGLTYSFDPAAAGVGVHIITYSFTDVNGCSNTITDNVEVFALPLLTFTALADLCQDAGVQLGNGGATPTGGVYSGPGVTDDGNGFTYTFDPLAAGVGVHVLTYTYTDVNSCTNSITDNVEVLAAPSFTITVTQDPSTCNGSDGFFTIAGLTPSTAYSLSYIQNAVLVGPIPIATDGAGEFTQGGLPAGTYASITVTFAGCSSVQGPFNLTNPGSPVINPLGPIVQCGGTYLLPTITGVLLINAQYYDAPGGPSGGGSIIPVGTAIGTTTTLYMYDENGTCSDQQVLSITINPLPTVTSVTGGGVYCAGATPTDIFVNVTGTGGWTVDFTIDGGATISLFGPTSPINLGNTPGIYVITGITDANCPNTAGGTQTITVNPLPTVTSVTGGGTYCVGSTPTDILVAVTGTGSWTINYTLNGTPTTATGAASPINLGNATGVYIITGVTDANCPNSASGTQTIIVNPLPTVVSITGGGTYCAGTTPNDILVNLTGTPGWTINYTLDGTPLSVSGGSSPMTLGNAAGVYVITGISDANCPNTAVGTQTITINPLPTVTSVTGGGSYCVGATPADILVAVTGSTSWTINYTLNGAPLTAAGAASPINLGNATGVYTITGVTDANCTNTASGTQTITINALPTVTTVSGGATYCGAGTVADILVAVTGIGGWTVNYTLDGTPLTATGVSSPINLGNAPGVYVITGVTDANCPNSASGTQTIIVNSLPSVTNVSGGGTYCSGTIVPDILVDVTGSGPWTIAYTLDGIPMSASGVSSPINLGISVGVYVITMVTDANCSDVAAGTQTIIINPSPALDPVADLSVCDEYVLPSITGFNLPGTENYYDNSQALSGSVLTGPLTTSQTVFVYVDNAGCTDEMSYVVTINATEDATFTLSNFCEGDVNGATIVGTTGGSFNFTIAVSDGATIDPTTGEITNGVGGTTYNVSYLTSGACPATSSESVLVYSIPPSPIVSGAGTYCENVPVVAISATGSTGTLNWYNSDPTGTPTPQSIGSGGSLIPTITIGLTTYYVTEEENGCVSPASLVDVIFEECEIIIPTAFTPNADTWNDDWEIVNLDNVYPDNVVYVYNRWGNSVFESIPGDYNGKRWDGILNGSLLPVGSYYYMVEFNDGVTEGLNGVVSIIVE